jgi:6-phosphofructokinase 1
MKEIKRIGVLTSGGDAPGMNAAIRAVVRAAIYYGLEPYGIFEGYQGLIDDNMKLMESHSVSNIIQRGGTILRSARCEEFCTPEGKAKAAAVLKNREIDALIVIGGDGTFTGARHFSLEHDIPVLGIPGTIDNDLYGTDSTIGFDTAINTVVQAVDKIRDTASAHNRLFFIEVMGRDAGFIALQSAIAVGAEAVLIPERDTHLQDLEKYLEEGYKAHKSSGIVIVAEGEKHGGAYRIAEMINKDKSDYDIRVTVLGHLQRGGSPSAYDRVLASRLGVAAVEALIDNKKNIMLGMVNNEIVHIPFSKAIKNTKELNQSLIDISKILSI